MFTGMFTHVYRVAPALYQAADAAQIEKKNESIIFCSFPAVCLPLSLSLSLSSHISFDCSKKNMTVLLYPLKSDRWLSTSVAIIHMAMYWWSIMFSVRRPLCLGWKPSNPASSSISSSNSLHNQADCPLAPQFFIHTLCWCLSWCHLFTDANVSCLLVCRFICRAAHRARVHTGNYMIIIIIIYYSNCILVKYWHIINITINSTFKCMSVCVRAFIHADTRRVKVCVHMQHTILPNITKLNARK